ncbi:hypothetical protein DES46_11529 [Caldimonas thermodepolymerans]|jgi:hypothetical protein|uniref:Uncharacterized protein n=1 Tax=Caldimonas thermodepolymerans TaxID=215580 RepID=A0AA46DBY9_9BURK|nr:hypothetical protein DES46_11529 [Caldimonas thermodepolymerans]TCP03248.1 hypothetical protein EV676_11326 [Caldimonas thermodepolymerans]
MQDAPVPQAGQGRMRAQAIRRASCAGTPYLAVGITNSAPFGVLSGQRCITDFWRV